MNRNGSGTPERGGTAAMDLLRAVVAVYLIYLGVSLILDRLAGRSDMALWLAWVCGVLFVLAGAAFGWFTWRHFRAGKAAEEDAPEIPEAPEEEKGRSS